MIKLTTYDQDTVGLMSNRSLAVSLSASLNDASYIIGFSIKMWMPSCEAKCKTNLICAVNETGSKGSKTCDTAQCKKPPIFYPTVLGSNLNIDASVLLSVIVTKQLVEKLL